MIDLKIRPTEKFPQTFWIRHFCGQDDVRMVRVIMHQWRVLRDDPGMAENKIGQQGAPIQLLQGVLIENSAPDELWAR